MTTTVAELVAQAKANIHEVSPSEAKTMFNHGTIALDVREPEEFTAEHISNAKHIPRGKLEFMIENHPELKDKSASIIVYCKSGGRSALATATLQLLGYTDVHSMAGGYDAWSLEQS